MTASWSHHTEFWLLALGKLMPGIFFLFQIKTNNLEEIVCFVNNFTQLQFIMELTKLAHWNAI